MTKELNCFVSRRKGPKDFTSLTASLTSQLLRGNPSLFYSFGAALIPRGVSTRWTYVTAANL